MSEPSRNTVNRRHHVVPGLGVGLEARHVAQGANRQDRRRPRAVVLCGEILTAYLLQVLVDIVRMDLVTCAVGADVLEQHLAWKLLASFDHPRNAPVRDAYFNFAPALALEKKSHARSADGYVPVAKRGETE